MCTLISYSSFAKNNYEMIERLGYLISLEEEEEGSCSFDIGAANISELPAALQ